MSPARQATLCMQDDCVLILVDIQSGLTAAMPIKVLARLQRNIGLLMRLATTLAIPMLPSAQEAEQMGEIESAVSGLLPQHTKIYNKTSLSCAGAAGFMPDLKLTGRRQVIIVGMETHISVLQSALELLAAGYQVFVPADAVCSRLRESYEIALQRLQQAGVIICDSESVLAEWLRDTGHEHFAPMQSLMKAR